jgi:hypothetical protein
MTGVRPKSAWIWVAVAAVTLASVARAELGIETARAYAHPLIAWIAGTQLAESGASASAHGAASPKRVGNTGMELDLLPIFFVGLVAPLSLLSPRWILCLGRALPAPALPVLFQRPPPVLVS